VNISKNFQAELLQVLSEKLPNLSKARTINLIVLDSIAGILRLEPETGTADPKSRTATVINVGLVLNSVAEEFSTPVVVINQVSILCGPTENIMKC